jgi:chromate reductase
MSPYNIAVIVGSLRRDSFNRKLARALTKLGPSDFSFKPVEIGGLPLYNQDDDGNPAESVKKL